MNVNILDLPPEVLSEICVWFKRQHIEDCRRRGDPSPFLTFNTVDDDEEKDDCNRDLSRSAVEDDLFRQSLLLGNICHALRHVAHATPQLWNTLALTLHAAPNMKTETKAKMELDTEAVPTRVALWLERSRGCALDVRLTCVGPARVWARCPPHGVLRVLAAQCQRWRELVLVGVPVQTLRTLRGVKGRTPALRRVVIQGAHVGVDVGVGLGREWSVGNSGPWDTRDVLVAEAEEGEEEGMEMDALEGAQSLEDVTLSGVSPRTLPLAWNRVHTFTADGLAEDELEEVLEAAPALDRCAVRLGALNRFTGTHNAPVRHETLRALSIGCLTCGSTAAAGLSGLVLPALRALEVKAEDVCWTPRALLALVERSGCTLEKLRLDVGYVSEAGVLACWTGLPSLREFALVNRGDDVHSSFTNRVIGALAIKQDEALLPNVKTLRISTRTFQFNPGVLLDMLCSRVGGEDKRSVGLELFELRCSGLTEYEERFEALDCIRMRRLTLEGMNVHIGREIVL